MIFLDMDGVLSDLVQAICDRFGCNGSIEGIWPPGEYHIAKVLNMKPHEVWGNLDMPFWRDIPPTAEFQFFKSLVKDRDYIIMTSPTHTNMGECVEGKYRWLRKHWPQAVREKRFSFVQRKELFATPNNMLIDDSDEKIRKFNEASGWTATVPRIWNSEYSHRHEIEEIMPDLLMGWV